MSKKLLSKIVCFRAEPKMVEQLAKIAQTMGLRKSSLLLMILTEFVNKNKGGK